MDALTIATVSRNYYTMPLWVGVEQGLFAAEGLDVILAADESIDAVTASLTNGKAQLARGITEHVILDNEAGGTLRIIAGNVNRLPFSLMASPTIGSIKELAGRTIGASSLDAGSSSLIMRILSDEGLTHPDDYSIVAVGPMLARWELLQSGTIDCGLQGIPFNYMARDAGFVSLVEPSDRFPDFQFTSLNVEAGWARAHQDVLVRFLRAYLRAHEWYYDNRQASSELIAGKMNISLNYALRAWDECTISEIMPRNGEPSPAAIQTLIDVSGLIRALPRRTRALAKDYIDRSYIDAARAGL